MLTGTLVTVAGFVPDRLRAQRRRRVHVLDLRRRRHRADRLLGRRGRLRAPARRLDPARSPRRHIPGSPARSCARFRRFLVLAMRARWVTILRHARPCSGHRSTACASSRSSSSRPPTGPSCWWTCSCRRTPRSTPRGSVSAQLDKLLQGDPDVDHWSTYVGQGAVRFYLPLDVQLPNDFFAQAVVVTKGLEQRERVQGAAGAGAGDRVPERRRARLSAGTRPAGRLAAPIPGERTRPRPGARDRVQGRRRSWRRGRASANVNYNWMEPARTVRIRVDQDQARLLGLSSQDLAQALNTVVSGVTATQVRNGIYLVDVLVRATAEQRMSLSTIRTLQVPLPNGRTVPLSQIASVEYGQEYPIVWRRDRRPTADGAGRCRARHAARHGRAGPGAEDRGAERRACRAATASTSAERSRRAARRRRRCWPSCR